MTVIAYSTRHRILAADSKCSDDDGMYLTNCRKVFRLQNGAVLGTAGDADDRDVRALLARSTPRKLPSRAALAELKCGFTGVLVFPKRRAYLVYVYARDRETWAGSVLPVLDHFAAAGSGAQLAYGAMEAGANPIEAVRAACRRDSACALPVQWEKIR